jgi:hypothetical protein
MRLRLIASIVLVGILGSALSCPDDKYCLNCGKNNKGENICNSCQDSLLNTETGQCDPIADPKIDKCINYTKNKDKIVCEHCEWGYRADSSSPTCIKCEQAGCASCPNIECDACLNGFPYQLSSHTCDLNSTIPIVNCNITTTIDEAMCLVCNEGYSKSIVGKICIKGIENCETVFNNDSPKCYECFPGYYITSDGGCKSVTASIHHWIIYSVVILVIAGVAFGVWMFMREKNSSRDMLNPML